MYSAQAVLSGYANEALLPRGRGKNARRRLDFPELQLAYARGRIDPDTGELRNGGSYRTDIWKFLETWGFRIFNDLRGAGIAPPSADELSELFSDFVLGHAITHHEYDGRGVKGSISTDDVYDLAQAAAEEVVRDWTPEYIDRQRERGRNGGKAGAPRRATKSTEANYQRFLRLPPGLTREQQAKRLKLKLGVIDTFRARRRRDDPFWDLLAATEGP